MNKNNILIILIGALATFVLLMFAPKTGPVATAADSGHSHGLDSHLAEFKTELDAEKLMKVESLEQEVAAASGAGKIFLLDSLARLWNDFRNPIASAIMYKEKAQASGNIEDLFESAERYFYASRFAEGHMSSHLLEDAVKGYEAVLQANPMHIDAKIGLGVSLVEGSIEPMKGVGLLKEVVELEPANIKAHVNLGYFSIKSGQYEKAIERFEEVIRIDPEYPESYLYLGDIYENQKDIDKAILNYTLYSEKVQNPMLQLEISRYIEKLKSN